MQICDHRCRDRVLNDPIHRAHVEENVRGEDEHLETIVYIIGIHYTTPFSIAEESPGIGEKHRSRCFSFLMHLRYLKFKPKSR